MLRVISVQIKKKPRRPMPPRLPTPNRSSVSGVAELFYSSLPQLPSPQDASAAWPSFMAPLQDPSPQEASAALASAAAAVSAPVVDSAASGPSSDLHAAVTLSAAVAIAMIVCLSAEFMSFLPSFCM
jgi:hypothetical protein